MDPNDDRRVSAVKLTHHSQTKIDADFKVGAQRIIACIQNTKLPNLLGKETKTLQK